MFESSKTLIKSTPSGDISLVMLSGELMTLQFNCKCEDALPLCHANCCRMRSSYNVSLQPDEVAKYRNIQHPAHPGRPELRVIQPSEDGHSCSYLTDDNKCATQDDKPKHCTIWHCSPGGKNSDGSAPKYKALGWAMLPFTGEIPAEVVVESLIGAGEYVDPTHAAGPTSVDK